MPKRYTLIASVYETVYIEQIVHKGLELKTLCADNLCVQTGGQNKDLDGSIFTDFRIILS